MTGHGGRRTRAELDAMTAEIGYAPCGAARAAAVAFGAVAGPALLLMPPDALETVLLRAGLVLAPVLFAVRTVGVPVRSGRPISPASPAAPVRTRRRGPPVGPGRGRPASPWCG
ncbi:hypothetical protein GCM10019016_087990 [Streptomyces prasinosporus]|uniref:HTH lacI-type domain-containing protein n=1 Tax=Streptomyces prasinosporus TaxID=68256 RepID=A0ABP6U2L5_9ACTN